MCQSDPRNRIQSFLDVEKEILSNSFSEIQFFGQELSTYRDFANLLTQHVTKIDNGIKYQDDIEKIKTQLEIVYRSFMLEDVAPDSAPILRCFLNGTYYYQKKGFKVSVVKNFLGLLKSSDRERQRIILANLHTRFDSIARYKSPPNFADMDDDIPF
jgi:eukaryotic-like serine/threonine-protein kinase